MEEDLYALLGADSGQPHARLRAAYLRACREAHPDKPVRGGRNRGGRRRAGASERGGVC